MPAVIFTLSKNRCESNADGLSNKDLTTKPVRNGMLHIFAVDIILIVFIIRMLQEIEA